MTFRSALRRFIVPSAIALFWLGMMGWLVYNHILPRAASGDVEELTPARLAEKWSDTSEYMTIRLGDRSEGVSCTLIEQRRKEGDFIACNRTWLDLDMLGGRHAFRLETVALLNAEFRLNQAVANLRIDDMPMTFKALATPKKLLYRWEFEGQLQVGSQPLDKPISLLEAARPLIGRKMDLKVGKVYRLPVLDSTWSLRQGEAEIRVEAEEDIRVSSSTVHVYRLATQLGPFNSYAWVDLNGRVWRRTMSTIVMERITSREASRRFPGIDAPIAAPIVTAADFEATSRSASLNNQLGPLGILFRLLPR
jgi:hypothetical protein